MIEYMIIVHVRYGTCNSLALSKISKFDKRPSLSDIQNCVKGAERQFKEFNGVVGSVELFVGDELNHNYEF